MRTRSYAHTLICLHAHTFIRSYAHTFIRSYAHTLIRSYAHTLIHSYAHTLIHSYTHTLIHSYTHTLIHTYTHVHTHVHTRTHTREHSHNCPTLGIFILLISLLIAIDWNFKELHHEVIINHHILRWCEWGLLVFCKQTPFQLAAIGTLNL